MQSHQTRPFATFHPQKTHTQTRSRTIAGAVGEQNSDQPPRPHWIPFKRPQCFEEFNLYRWFPPNVLTSLQNNKHNSIVFRKTKQENNSTSEAKPSQRDWPPLRMCGLPFCGAYTIFKFIMLLLRAAVARCQQEISMYLWAQLMVACPRALLNNDH